MKGRRNWVRLLALALVLVLAFGVLAACGAGGQTGGQGSGSESSSSEGAPSGDSASSGPAETLRLSIATGGTGGIYYPLGGGLANLINDEIPGTEATAEVTGASVENVRLVHANEAQLAFIQGDVGWNGYNGEKDFDQPQEIRTLLVLYPNLLQIITLEKFGISRFADLAGRKVSVGAPGSGTEFFMNAVTTTLGMSYDDFGQVQRLPFADQTNAIKNGTLEVGTWVVGAGTSSITDLATTEKIKAIGFTDEELAKIAEAYPYYRKATLRGGTYPGYGEDVPVPAVWNLLITRSDMDEELAYNLVKVVFDNLDKLGEVHSAAKDIALENVLNSPIPLHKGAVKYFQEQGIDLPDDLIPPEAR